MIDELTCEQTNLDVGIFVKDKLNKERRSRYRKYINWEVNQLNDELEIKLPNEFRGKIRNYNHYTIDFDGHIDENNYNF